jgi:hypothetical protein
VGGDLGGTGGKRGEVEDLSTWRAWGALCSPLLTVTVMLLLLPTVVLRYVPPQQQRGGVGGHALRGGRRGEGLLLLGVLLEGLRERWRKLRLFGK